MLISDLTDWAPAQSDGTLPPDTDANGFRMRHYISWELDTAQLSLGIGYQDATGKWKYRIEDPAGLPIFEQQVEETLRFVNLGAPGLQLVSWQHLKEKITTTIVNGMPVSDSNKSYEYTIGGEETSEFGTLIPGDGVIAVSGAFVITAFHEGPLYYNLHKQQIIPVGSRLRVLIDGWDLGASTNPEFQFQFHAGNVELDARFIPSGALLIAKPSGQDVVVGKGWTGFTNISPRSTLQGSSNPCLNQDSHGMLYLGVRQDDGYNEHLSMDGGYTWKLLAKMWDTGASMQRVILLTDGARGTLAKQSVSWVFKTSRDGYTTGVPITGLSASLALCVEKADTGVINIISLNGVELISTDDGHTFKLPSAAG